MVVEQRHDRFQAAAGDPGKANARVAFYQSIQAPTGAGATGEKCPIKIGSEQET
jgi:hypothetical protein